MWSSRCDVAGTVVNPIWRMLPRRRGPSPYGRPSSWVMTHGAETAGNRSRRFGGARVLRKIESGHLRARESIPSSISTRRRFGQVDAIFAFIARRAILYRRSLCVITQNILHGPYDIDRPVVGSVPATVGSAFSVLHMRNSLTVSVPCSTIWRYDQCNTRPSLTGPCVWASRRFARRQASHVPRWSFLVASPSELSAAGGMPSDSLGMCGEE